jgi:hypothetical protein
MESEATALKEPLYEKYSWIFLLVAPLILSILNIQALVYGYSFSAPSNLLSGAVTASTPGATVNLLNYIARGSAGGSLLLMVLVLAIAVTGYRRGQRWAWFIEAYIFLGLVATVGMEITEGQNNGIGILILGVPSILGLLLPYRKFFPKRPGLASR